MKILESEWYVIHTTLGLQEHLAKDNNQDIGLCESSIDDLYNIISECPANHTLIELCEIDIDGFQDLL